MQHRPLGNSGIEASVVGIGTTVTGGGDTWQGPDDKDSIRAIQAALDCGINLIDTAPSYGWGHSEEVVGQAIRGRRDKVVVATKCGIWWRDNRGSYNSNKDGRDTRVSLRPDTIRIEVEDSLRRLNIDYIDLLRCHRPAIPPEQTPVEETMACLTDLRAEGKIRAIGVSNVSVGQLEGFRAAGDIASDQLHYSLLFPNPETDLLPYCKTNNIATLTYMSLEQGLLSGKAGPDRVFSPDDFRHDVGAWLPWFKLENRQRLADMFANWTDLTDKYNCTIAQLVIAWTAAQAGVTHVLCGTRTVAQGEQLANVGDIVLEASDTLRIREEATALGNPV